MNPIDPMFALIALVREKQDAAKKAHHDTAFHLECVRAYLKVYHAHGELHPSEYGVGESVGMLESKLAGLHAEVTKWGECFELLATIDCAHVVSGSGVQPERFLT